MIEEASTIEFITLMYDEKKISSTHMYKVIERSLTKIENALFELY